MALGKILYPVVTLGAASAIFQSSAWIALSLVGILYHYEVLRPDFPPSSPDTLLAPLFYCQYVGGTFCKARTGILITPDIFSYLLWVYLGLSFLWLCTSAALLFGSNRIKPNVVKPTLNAWIPLTVIISSLDLAVTIVLGIDLNYTIRQEGSEVPAIVTGILMTLAARGFILWILNVIYIIIFVRFRISMRDNPRRRSHLNSFINAYSTTNTVPWFTEAVNDDNQIKKYPSTGADNPAFNLDSENVHTPFTRSHSFIGQNRDSFPMFTDFDAPLGNPVRSASPGRPGSLAGSPGYPPGDRKIHSLPREHLKPIYIPPPKIPRPVGQHTGPYIPEPDYSPPVSPIGPKLKSVLKPPRN